jgi:hypothetical protein
MHAWRGWVDTVPDEVMSVGRFMQFPPIPDIPEPLRGRSFAIVEAAYIGNETDGAELIEPLRALGPQLDTFATIPVETLDKLHMDPEHPVPGAGDGMMLTDITTTAIDALAETLGGGSSLLSVEIRHLGGELANARAENGAFASVDAAFVMFAVGMAMTPEMGEAVESEVEQVKSALASWAAPRMYMNFADKPRTGKSLFGDAHERLREVKAAYDADNLFRGNHPIYAAPTRTRKRTRGPRKVLVD